MLSHAPMLDNSLRYKEVTLVQCNHTIHLSLPGADMYYYSCMHVMYAVLVSFSCRYVLGNSTIGD